jgi:hypothetical protein
MIHPALVNPFFELGDMPSSGAADVLDAATWPSAANQPERYSGATAGYPCCYKCGYREPCDQWCPNSVKHESSVCEFAQVGNFQIDEYAFMAEIEPVPEFIRRVVG